MRKFETSNELRAAINSSRGNGESLALVPTMGHLHEGHLSLIRMAKQQADRVIVTIFVNPMQFNQPEDLQNYPVTLDQDSTLLTEEEVDWLFIPKVEEMYPLGIAAASKIKVPGSSEMLEGAFRPGHFTGVATVVAKLFNIVQPDLAIFGEKDRQQLQVIQQMVKDLNFPLRIIAAKTIREEDGLAMSSRNSLLSAENRQLAPKIYSLLSETALTLKSGNRSYSQLEENGMDQLSKAGFKPEYFSIRNADSLQPALEENSKLVILVAAHLDAVRLIDNLAVMLEK